MLEVVDPFDRVSEWSNCVMEEGPCSPDHPCALHEKSTAARAAYLDLLRNSTLAEMAAASEPV